MAKKTATSKEPLRKWIGWLMLLAAALYNIFVTLFMLGFFIGKFSLDQVIVPVIFLAILIVGGLRIGDIKRDSWRFLFLAAGSSLMGAIICGLALIGLFLAAFSDHSVSLSKGLMIGLTTTALGLFWLSISCRLGNHADKIAPNDPEE